MSLVVESVNKAGTIACVNDWREALANLAENLRECTACCKYVICCSLGCCKNKRLNGIVVYVYI